MVFARFCLAAVKERVCMYVNVQELCTFVKFGFMPLNIKKPAEGKLGGQEGDGEKLILSSAHLTKSGALVETPG